MTRADLIAVLTQKYQSVPSSSVDQGVRHIVEFLSQALIQGERIELRNFGSFDVRERAPRTCHNPRTGEKVMVSTRKSVHFKPSMALRKRVNTLPLDENCFD